MLYAYESMRSAVDILLHGAAVGVFSSLENLLSDCQQLHPTVFSAVPAFWHGLYRQFEGLSFVWGIYVLSVHTYTALYCTSLPTHY